MRAGSERLLWESGPLISSLFSGLSHRPLEPGACNLIHAAFRGAALLPMTVVLRCDKSYTESNARQRTPETLTCWTYPSPGVLWGGTLAGATPTSKIAAQ